MAPQMTRCPTSCFFSRSSRFVPRKLFGKTFVMTGSAGSGSTAGWISAPGVPGMKNVAPGRFERWRTWTTGSDRSRKTWSRELAFPAAASMPTSCIAPPVK